nr:hypothetical protein [uncultured Allomuricauda sp.]
MNSNYHIVRKILCILMVVLFSVEASIGQTQDSLHIDDPQIMVMARSQKENGIKLRWAVTTPTAWRKLNIHGYQLKRYTVIRDSAILKQPEEKGLGIFIPRALEEWLPLVENNDNAAVLAQSIYGESFSVEGMDELSAIVNLAEEQEQRFTWGLYAADQDFEVAEMAGLGYIDRDTKINEKYLYKIVSLVPDSILSIKEGGVFIGARDYEELPKPLDLAGIFIDGKTMLSWNYAIHKETYNSYYVERSEDGRQFNRLNNLPLTSLNHAERTDSQRMFFTDSIANGTTYYYRVKGKTPFGEIGPASETVSGKGEEQLPYVPHITTKYFMDDTTVILEWEFLEKGNRLIKGFELNRSDEANGVYETVMRSIPAEARKIKYDGLLPTNYLTITALGKNGSKRTSFPALVQPVDSIPPKKPKGFKGIIDSLGIVTLTWEPNLDKDILGYRLFKGNNNNEEFTQITISPHQGTMYFDSVSVKNLNPKTYYQLIAVDQRFNMSEPSETLELKKPDFIKPTQPVFKSYLIKDNGVHLQWANSSSDDVSRHEIYRKERDSTMWTLIHTIPIHADSIKDNIPPYQKGVYENWIDETVENNQHYSYTLVAVDESGLESDPAPILTIITPRTRVHPPIEGLAAQVEKEKGFVEIFWRLYKQENVSKLEVYKGLVEGPMNLLREIPADTKRIVDRNVKANNKYAYMLRARFKDGSVSQTSTLNINY